MSADCTCLGAFPPREFKTARAADEFMSRIRVASAFRFLRQQDGPPSREIYRCRACGLQWECVAPDQPPYRWGPAGDAAPPGTPPAPAPPIPIARPRAAATPAAPVYLEVGGPIRETVAGIGVLYNHEARTEVASVMKSLLDWRPGLSGWAANAGMAEVEVEIGPPLDRKSSVFDLFAQTWDPGIVNPAWRGFRGGKNLRPVHLRGIRKRTAQGAGFQGEYYLVAIDTRAKQVVAWMMAEANG